MENELKLPLLVPEEEMELSLSFIPMKDAFIGWNMTENKEYQRKIELKVFFCKIKESIKIEKHLMPPSGSFECCSGACWDFWEDMTIPKLTCECFRILMDYPMLDQQESLLEFSKIEELEDLREMTFMSFFSDEYHDDYEAFLNTHFGV